ncbi:MAG TPA: anhydro-N-acetylmuramic acid kinase [Chitinophagaceae bacterium]|jgi:anhydro-N-acetylmuramic acid kinase|nr:anhydro-N-acetylmuramic acid kinase [Chitinophagaceae bacterium]
MIYRAIGVMSGSSLDGLDIAFAEFQENAGKWNYEIRQADCYSYDKNWNEKLKSATSLNSLDYQLLDVEFGHYIGEQINKFIEEHELQYQVALIASHGHTTFHIPSKKMTAQLGDGASIAAETQLPVITDLRALDLAFGGQGAPIVPIGEKWLLGDFDFFLNLGGIANVSFKSEPYIAFDICAANRVLNMLVSNEGKEYDDKGEMAQHGEINFELLRKLNGLDYYTQPYPKSLANDFGTDTVYPIIVDARCKTSEALRTYVEHIVIQIKDALTNLINNKPLQGNPSAQTKNRKLLVTGGGAFNTFLVSRLTDELKQMQIDLVVPDEKLIQYKEAMIMAFMGVLRWRQEYNVLSSVTGASRDSIGGALWIGQEA